MTTTTMFCLCASVITIKLSCLYCLDFGSQSIYQLVVGRISTVANVEVNFVNLSI